ncbi:VanZ family protein [Cellulomonas soli]
MGSAILAAGALSLTIEITQWVTAHALGGGHIADMNDLIFNVLGGAVGVAIVAAAGRVPVLARVVDQVRWHDGPGDGPEVPAGSRAATRG